MVTSVVFAPDSHLLIEQMERHQREKDEKKASSLSVDGTTGRRSTADGTRPPVDGAPETASASSGNRYVLVSADFNG